MRNYNDNSIKLEIVCSRTYNTVFLHFNIDMVKNGIDCIDLDTDDVCKRVRKEKKEYQGCMQGKIAFRDEYGKETHLDPTLYDIDTVSCDGTRGSVVLLRNTKNKDKTMAVRCKEYGLNKDDKASCAANIGVGGCSQFKREIKKLPKG